MHIILCAHMYINQVYDNKISIQIPSILCKRKRIGNFEYFDVIAYQSEVYYFEASTFRDDYMAGGYASQ